MPPFRTSWLYLASPFTLQIYNFFVNPPNFSLVIAPESVKSVKISASLEFFSSKSILLLEKMCIFAPVLLERAYYHICSNSPDEPLPRIEKDEQNLYIVGAAHSADFIHKCIGAVAGLSGDMAVVCAFLCR
jgi:hypothetical protein